MAKLTLKITSPLLNHQMYITILHRIGGFLIGYVPQHNLIREVLHVRMSRYFLSSKTSVAIIVIEFAAAPLWKFGHVPEKENSSYACIRIMVWQNWYSMLLV